MEEDQPKKADGNMIEQMRSLTITSQLYPTMMDIHSLKQQYIILMMEQVSNTIDKEEA